MVSPFRVLTGRCSRAAGNGSVVCLDRLPNSHRCRKGYQPQRYGAAIGFVDLKVDTTVPMAEIGKAVRSRPIVIEFRQQLEAESKRREHEFEVEGERRRHALELQEERLRVELRTEYMAEAAIAQMLWKAEPLRSFARIKDRIGGFDYDELRRLLVRAGALRFTSNDGKTELWGLRDRNEP